MKPNELRKKSGKELRDELLALSKEHFNLRMQKGSRQLQKTDAMKKVKRNIARIKTILHEQKSKEKVISQ